MVLSLRDLIAHREFGLVELHSTDSSAREISWASSSDLTDPTPFLVPSQLLLTTGSQFGDGTDDAAYRGYVERLIAHDVLGIGFGTEVVRQGTPPGLIDACRDAGLALVEVPYRTPFLAIIRRVATERERAARERDDWALGALRSISAAALRRGDVDAVLRELASRLGARVALFDADGELERAYPTSRGGHSDPAVTDAVRRLLASGSRAADEVGSDPARTWLQTVGPTDAPAGVLAVTGPRPDRAARTVLTAAIAFVEVGSAEARRGARFTLAKNGVTLRLLREGRPDLVDLLRMPSSPFIPGDSTVVVAVPRDPDALEQLAEREARSDDRFVVVDRGRLICVVPARAGAPIARRLATVADSVGTAQIDGPHELETGIVRADAARRIASRGEPSAWESMPSGGEAGVDTLAASISVIATTDPGALQIAAAEAWFDENCNWGRAARRLGIHPHTARDRVTDLATRLAVSLDDFAGRARLWNGLRAYRLGSD